MRHRHPLTLGSNKTDSPCTALVMRNLVAAMADQIAQLCRARTLGSPPLGSPVDGIVQPAAPQPRIARIALPRTAFRHVFACVQAHLSCIVLYCTYETSPAGYHSIESSSASSSSSTTLLAAVVSPTLTSPFLAAFFLPPRPPPNMPLNVVCTVPALAHLPSSI